MTTMSKIFKFVLRQKPKIFMSYRREDSGGHAGRIHADLVRRFGINQIFMDIGTVAPGDDFIDAVNGAIQSCDALIAIIGKQWLTISDGTTPRLKNPKDYVRLEISKALQRKIPVIPVLVQGAVLPSPQDLPHELESLTRKQALEISDTRWDYDVKRLNKRLGAVLPNQTVAWGMLGIGLGCVAIIIFGLWLTYSKLYPTHPEKGAPLLQHNYNPLDLQAPDKSIIKVEVTSEGTTQLVSFAINGEPRTGNTLTFSLDKAKNDPAILTVLFQFSNSDGGVYKVRVTSSSGGPTSEFEVRQQGGVASEAITYTIDVT